VSAISASPAASGSGRGIPADPVRALQHALYRAAETDIASCFSAIPHEKLMQAVQERICDQAVLKLLRVMLRAGVMEDGQVRRAVTGTPQGGVLSPLMCNVYLHRLDRAWTSATGCWCGSLTTWW
jgi:retron-type reverse transcriptase